MSAPQVIQGPPKLPDPYQVAKDQRDETREDRRDRREETKTDFTQQNQSIDNMKALRQEFAQLPEVKNYQTLLQQFGTAAKAPETGAGDLAIIYAFGKANDPSSAVREGELSLAQQTASLPQGLQQWVSRIESGQRLAPDVRKNLIESIRQKGIAAARAYNLQRDFYRKTSERYKYDPDLVIGPHPGEPFQQSEADFTGHVIRNRDQSLGAIPGGMQPKASDDGGIPDPRTLVGVREKLEQELNQDSGGLSVDLGSFTPEQQQVWDALSQEQKEAWGRGQLYIPALDDTVEQRRQAKESDRQRDTVPGAIDAFGRGVADTLTFGFADELAAGGNTLLNPNTTFADNLAAERARDQQDERVNSLSRFGGQVAGGLALPIGAEAKTARDFARVGAAGGLLYGYGSGTDLQSRLTGAGTNALAGAALGYGGAKIAPKIENALARLTGPSPARTAREATMEAADKLDVQMLPGDVGGTGSRMATGAFGRSLGGVFITDAARKGVQQAGRARDRIAQSIGRVEDRTGAGQAAQAGVNQWMDQTEKRAEQLYNAIPVPPRRMADLGNTRRALEELTQGLDSNPELSRLWTENPRLKATLDALTPGASASERLGAARAELSRAQEGLRQARVTEGGNAEAARAAVMKAREAVREAEALAKTQGQGVAGGAANLGQLSWQDLKRFRTIIGQIAGRPSVGDDGATVEAMRKLYGALSEDMRVTARATGPKALQSFERANQFWRGRETRIEDTLTGLMGNKYQKGEGAAFDQIQRWSQGQGGDFKRLAQAMRSMPRQQADSVRATLFGRMGNATPANGGEATFSSAEFVKQWNAMDNRAKAVLIPNAEHRANLDRLALVANAQKQAGQFANHSNTALGGNITALGAVGWLADPLSALGLAGTQLAAGKLLASPAFARWLARPPKTAAAAKVWGDRLKAIGAKNPAIANEIGQLERALMNAVNDNGLTRAAASGNDPRSKEQDQRRPR